MNTRHITIALVVLMLVVAALFVGYTMTHVDMSGLPAYSSTLANNGGRIDKDAFCTAADVLSNVCK